MAPARGCRPGRIPGGVAVRRFPPPRALAGVLVLLGVLVPSASAGRANQAPVLDLEALTGLQARTMLEDGSLTSVQLTRAYIRRIESLNKCGPGLNAVTQLNPQALEDAARLDRERAQGHVRSPVHGMPV